MSGLNLNDFRTKLLEAKASVANRVVQAETDGREADADGMPRDIADKASNSYTKELLFSKSNSDRQFLQMIEQALDRIDDGSFGACLRCDEPIGEKRINAVPWAQFCIKCQELKERGRF